MRRQSRLFLAATLSTLAALLPVTAFASSLTVSVVGVQYAVGNPSWCSDTTSSFAGLGSVIPGGQGAVFQTTICHTAISDAGADILPGGSFHLATSSVTLVGQYLAGAKAVGPGAITGNRFCKEVFGVGATLTGVPAASVPPGAISISGGSATGRLTHYGVRDASGCHAYAATITGLATLLYP